MIPARYRRVWSKVGSSGKYKLAGFRSFRFQNVGLQKYRPDHFDPTRRHLCSISYIMVPRVIPKIFYAKSMMFELSKIVSTASNDVLNGSCELSNFFIPYDGSLHPGLGKIRATRHWKAEGPYFSTPIFIK